MLQLELLWEINCIDREINNLNKAAKDRELYNRINKIKENYSVIKKELDKESIELQKNSNEVKNMNDELDLLYKKMKEDEKRLYQNGQNMKSIDNIQKEMHGFRSRIDEVESRILNLMEVNEKAGMQLDDKRKELAAYRGEMEVLRQKYILDSEKNNKEVESLKLKREKIKKEIDMGLMKKYDEIASKKNNAVSMVSDGTCQECGVKLNAMLYDALRKNEQICICDHCGRILYME